MRSKKNTRYSFRKKTYRKRLHKCRQNRHRKKNMHKKKSSRARKYHRGGGCLDIYPLSSCGGAVGRCDPYIGTANQNGGWRIKNVSGRRSAEKSTKKYIGKRSHRKKRTYKTKYMRGGSPRDPIIGSELQQGLYSVWNTGEKAYNTWNGVKSPFSLDASPLNQPVDLS